MDSNFDCRIMCRVLENCLRYDIHVEITNIHPCVPAFHATCVLWVHSKGFIPASNLCNISYPHPDLYRSMQPIVLRWRYNITASNKCPVIGERLLSGDLLQGQLTRCHLLCSLQRQPNQFALKQLVSCLSLFDCGSRLLHWRMRLKRRRESTEKVKNK